MSERFCKVPGCSKPGPYSSGRALGNHQRSHAARKVCDFCGQEYDYLESHKKHCREPEVGEEVEWDVAELEDRAYWKDRALKAEARADKAEAESKRWRRLNNEKAARLRKQ